MRDRAAARATWFWSARQHECSHDMGATRATCFLLGPRSRHLFCVATWLGWGMLVLGRDMILCRDRGSCWGCRDMSLTSRHESCKGGEIGVTTHFWCRDRGELKWCHDIVLMSRHCYEKLMSRHGFDVATWVAF